MMQNPSNYINDWLWHRVHVSADGLTMERDVSGWEKTSRLFMLSLVPADSSIHTAVRRVVHSHAFFISNFARFLYIHAGIFKYIRIRIRKSLLGRFLSEWSLTSSLICESYLNEHMYCSKVHFSFRVIASLKHFCTDWSAAWNNPLDFKYHRAPLFTKQSYCHSCLLIVWKGCLL